MGVSRIAQIWGPGILPTTGRWYPRRGECFSDGLIRAVKRAYGLFGRRCAFQLDSGSVPGESFRVAPALQLTDRAGVATTRPRGKGRGALRITG
jgi:hypothetical protein